MYLLNYLNPQSIAQQYIAAARFRTGQQLVGLVDGVNVTFTIPAPDKFTHNLPFLSIQIYWNGIRLTLIDDYTIYESGGVGTGYDMVVLEVPPRPGDHLLIDYIATDGP